MQVSKNFKLGSKIENPLEINDLARKGEMIAYGQQGWFRYNMKPAGFVQNWSIRTISKFEFFKVEKIKQ